jgi:hypothetical protein
MAAIRSACSEYELSETVLGLAGQQVLIRRGGWLPDSRSSHRSRRARRELRIASLLRSSGPTAPNSPNGRRSLPARRSKCAALWKPFALPAAFQSVTAALAPMLHHHATAGAMHPPGRQKIALYSGCNAIAPAHQPRRRPRLPPAHGQIPIAEPATPPSTCPSPWFRPWRFSDACRGVCVETLVAESGSGPRGVRRGHTAGLCWCIRFRDQAPARWSRRRTAWSTSSSVQELHIHWPEHHRGAPAPFACVITQARGLPRRVDRISLRSAT